MAFNQAFLDQIQAAMARLVESGAAAVQIGDQTITYTDIKKLQDFYDYVESRVNAQNTKSMIKIQFNDPSNTCTGYQ